MSQKNIIAVLLIVAAGIAAWYFFLRKPGALQGALIGGSKKGGLGPEDDAAFNRMLEYIRANSSGQWLTWLLPYVEQTLHGTNVNPISPDYLINGKVSKTGALLADYARAVFKTEADGGAESIGLKEGKTVQQFNQEMYQIFYDLRSKLILSDL